MRKSCIPNVFTFINLSCGIISILSVMNEKYAISGAFILLAGLVDRYDGRIARFLNVSSELGKELDSLADLVSFGVAPSILVYILFNLESFGPNGLLGFVVLLLFPICGAYRLARFNTAQFDGVFTGVPITIVGCFMALFSLIILRLDLPMSTLIYPVVILMIIGSYLMVSKLQLKKF
ncbi:MULTISPECIES: CDP-diacylglycerol--serine O-phosphatidyltransferase [unclassified Clostridium]|uniref:CDP-diacylglycerol--serine O-phosphatidyltransferase n=1 Tax=unclassified Clostridium TaxID=2614128 RepID=UPI0002979755|nr:MULTISPECIES: CDP-diacylglycerol--serine O-phosphatidyltransferase [unclassified Clostridium]EKQ58169.1 MAG: CDP-diacylglycerol--serine O-phosphatidyltransferase [Clostridium sp. Maddingley MBC34-26]